MTCKRQEARSRLIIQSTLALRSSRLFWVAGKVAVCSERVATVVLLVELGEKVRAPTLPRLDKHSCASGRSGVSSQPGSTSTLRALAGQPRRVFPKPLLGLASLPTVTKCRHSRRLYPMPPDSTTTIAMSRETEGICDGAFAGTPCTGAVKIFPSEQRSRRP